LKNYTNLNPTVTTNLNPTVTTNPTPNAGIRFVDPEGQTSLNYDLTQEFANERLKNGFKQWTQQPGTNQQLNQQYTDQINKQVEKLRNDQPGLFFPAGEGEDLAGEGMELGD
jgi:hypothetical protein